MEFVVDANIVLRSNAGAKQQSKDSIDSLAAELTAALKQRAQLHGNALKLAVALGEAQSKQPSLASQKSITISKLPFTQAFQDSFAAEGADAAVGEELVSSKRAHERLAAALNSLGRTGYTLVSTPPNVRPTVRDYHYAYTNGLLTPTEVAERVIAFIEKNNSTHNILSSYSAEQIRHQAAAASVRYSAGKALSVFDGVPFVVKDCLDALPYDTSCGTKFMSDIRPATSDAPCVATLKSLGAVLLGKAAMTELGALESSSSSTANPHNPAKAAGGSNAGCAAAVAAGLCPIAVGTDAGGAVALAGCFCGVVGLKASSGRLADDSAAAGSKSSLTATTPIANSVGDAMLLYAAMANVTYPGAAAPKALALPKDLLPLQERSAANADYILGSSQPLKGLKVGLCKQWVDESSPAVREVVEQAVARLQQLGATTVNVTLPELQQMQACHLVTFSKEAAADATQQGWINNKSMRSQLGLETRMFLCDALKVTDADYTKAQRVRAGILAGFESTMKQCDVILTPAAPDGAPALPKQQEATGVYDVAAASSMSRFGLGASLTGLPALVMPAGRQGGAFMPIGVQLIAKPWAESTLLRTAAALEQQMLEDGYPHQVARTALNPIQCEIGAHPVAARVAKETWASRPDSGVRYYSRHNKA